MRVGTRTLVNGNNFISRDHPHACGDKPHGTFLCKTEKGSSPCVWGQVKEKAPLERGCGIIPMRVGTSHLFTPFVKFFQDHPHACGDKSSLIILLIFH